MNWFQSVENSFYSLFTLTSLCVDSCTWQSLSSHLPGMAMGKSYKEDQDGCAGPDRELPNCHDAECQASGLGPFHSLVWKPKPGGSQAMGLSCP